MKFRRAKYIGWHNGLKGEDALLRPAMAVGKVLARFDDFDLVYLGENLEHDWHVFPATDFDGDNVHDWEEDDE